MRKKLLNEISDIVIEDLMFIDAVDPQQSNDLSKQVFAEAFPIEKNKIILFLSGYHGDHWDEKTAHAAGNLYCKELRELQPDIKSCKTELDAVTYSKSDCSLGIHISVELPVKGDAAKIATSLREAGKKVIKEINGIKILDNIKLDSMTEFQKMQLAMSKLKSYSDYI